MVPGSGVTDSAGGRSLLICSTVFSCKILPFLTRPCCDATYIEREKRSSQYRAPGSPSCQRILRVAMEVHNNKEVGP